MITLHLLQMKWNKIGMNYANLHNKCDSVVNICFQNELLFHLKPITQINYFNYAGKKQNIQTNRNLMGLWTSLFLFFSPCKSILFHHVKCHHLFLPSAHTTHSGWCQCTDHKHSFYEYPQDTHFHTIQSTPLEDTNLSGATHHLALWLSELSVPIYINRPHPSQRSGRAWDRGKETILTEHSIWATINTNKLIDHRQ